MTADGATNNRSSNSKIPTAAAPGIGLDADNITNVGGLGGLTGDGTTEGFRIVEVQGNSAVSAFALGAPLAAGGFTY